MIAATYEARLRAGEKPAQETESGCEPRAFYVVTALLAGAAFGLAAVSLAMIALVFAGA